MPKKRRKDTDVDDDSGVEQLKVELEKLLVLCHARGAQGHFLEGASAGRSLYDQVQFLLTGLMKLDEGEVLFPRTKEQFTAEEWNAIREHWEATRETAMAKAEKIGPDLEQPTVSVRNSAPQRNKATPNRDGPPRGDPDSGWTQPGPHLVKKAEYDDNIPF